MSDLDKVRLSLQRRVVELLQRELPEGWQCRAEGDGLLLGQANVGQQGEKLISLEPLYKAVETQPEQRREQLYQFVEKVLASVRGQLVSRDLNGQEKNVYPVIRHHSFAGDRTDRFVTSPHTEETVIAYALDHLEGYVLIDEMMLQSAGWKQEELHQRAMDNVKKLPFSVRTQEVGGHLLYFIAPKDGYAASRVLLTDLLEQYSRTKKGKSLGVAIPHQDVLILADLKDDEGAHLLARLAYDFATKGPIPISPLPFYYEQGELQPFIVVQHQTPKNEKWKG